MIKRLWILLLGLLLISGLSSEASAEEGVYFGLAIPYNTIDGDFDGESALSGDNDIIIVPEIDGGQGFGLLLGLGVHVLVVKDGSVNVFTGEVGDATYTGIGFNLGAGVDHYLSSSVSAGLGFVYRVVSYDQAEGVTDEGELDDPLSGNGYSLVFNLSYHVGHSSAASSPAPVSTPVGGGEAP
jgi:hypothetical protein